jgi:hypothetical protein
LFVVFCGQDMVECAAKMDGGSQFSEE